MTHPPVHPSRGLPVQIGTIAGYRVWRIGTGGGQHPELPAGGMGAGSATWHALGAAPWVPDVRAVRIWHWLDPAGSPWSLADLPDVLAEAGLYDIIQESDWPPECRHLAYLLCPINADHWRHHLPAAIRSACERYAAQASP